jgi:site-specific recombinase XerD
MRLLSRGVGVKAIGDVLGHRSLESTCAYLRLDVATLRGVALPVPSVRQSAEGVRHA